MVCTVCTVRTTERNKMKVRRWRSFVHDQHGRSSQLQGPGPDFLYRLWETFPGWNLVWMRLKKTRAPRGFVPLGVEERGESEDSRRPVMQRIARILGMHKHLAPLVKLKMLEGQKSEPSATNHTQPFDLNSLKFFVSGGFE